MSTSREQTDKLRTALPAILSTGLTTTSPHPTTKSKWMSMVYLLQEACRAPLGYRFTLYTYGPYSPEVEMDLMAAKEHGHVLLQHNPGDNWHQILPGPDVHRGTEQITGDWSPHMAAVRTAIRAFGHLTSSQANLRASTHYIANTHNLPAPSEQDLAAALHELKPQIDRQEIRDALNHLRTMGVLHNAKR